jgi:hypothetical protein
MVAAVSLWRNVARAKMSKRKVPRTDNRWRDLDHNLCQYIRGQSDMVFLARELGGAQIVGSRLAGPTVCNDVERYSLALVQSAHTGAFDRTDMNEDVLVTVLRLNEAKALLVVKPLHSTRVHRVSFH